MSTPAAGRLQDRLSRFGTRLGGSSLKAGTGGFLSWWGSALASWLPPRVRRLLGMDRVGLAAVVADVRNCTKPLNRKKPQCRRPSDSAASRGVARQR